MGRSEMSPSPPNQSRRGRSWGGGGGGGGGASIVGRASGAAGGNGGSVPVEDGGGVSAAVVAGPAARGAASGGAAAGGRLSCASTELGAPTTAIHDNAVTHVFRLRAGQCEAEWAPSRFGVVVRMARILGPAAQSVKPPRLNAFSPSNRVTILPTSCQSRRARRRRRRAPSCGA